MATATSTAGRCATRMAAGAIIRSLPSGCPPVMVGAVRYYSCGGSWYQSQGSQYVVVAPPQ